MHGYNEADFMAEETKRPSIAVNRVITFTPAKGAEKTEYAQAEQPEAPQLEQPQPQVAHENGLVWLVGNLVYEAGQYFPQLCIKTNMNGPNRSRWLEEGLNQLINSGFHGNGWVAHYENGNASVRMASGTPSAPRAFSTLRQLTEQASKRSGLSFGRPN